MSLHRLDLTDLRGNAVPARRGAVYRFVNRANPRMIRGSVLVAVAAVLLSLFMHGLGLNLLVREEMPPSSGEGPSEQLDVGGGFEDIARPLTEAAAPETASVPEPPAVTSPQPVTDVTPMPQALVASDNPQDVVTPDTGTAKVTEPDSAEPSENNAPAPASANPSGGEDETNANIAGLQPVEPDTAPEEPQGAADASAEPTASMAVADAPGPAIQPEPELLVPEQPDITVASLPDDPEILTAEESSDGSLSAVARSLRPPKERPSAEALGVQPGVQSGNSSGVIESPLTAFKRSGVNLLAYGGGSRSGANGFSGSRASGNSSTTNYVGQVLVQLNRSPSLYGALSGTAQVQFQINPNGTLAWVRVIRSSGSRGIERAARAQVRSAAPFPPTPQGTSQTLVFTYRNR